MGKLLRVLAVFFLLLSVVALVFAIMLFNKRELLIGRTLKLEKALISLGPFIESQAAEPQQATYPAKDTSDCTSDLLDNPNKSEFWNTYQLQLEQQDRPTLDVGARKGELQSYYLMNPVEQRPMRDAQGYKITTGKGTMQALLDDVLNKAEEQHKRLNQTRNQLRLLREELVTTIEELNRRKATLRQSLNEIVQLKNKITQLDENIRQLQENIKKLEDEKRALTEKVAEKDQEIAKRDEEIKELKEEIKRQRKKIADLLEVIRTSSTQDHEKEIISVKIDAGVKGTVASVNKKMNFIVVNLTDAFMKEILGPEMTGPLPTVQLMVKRPDASGAFVTKIKLINIKRDQKLAIANVLLDWQQQEVREGDIVFF